MSNLSGVTNYFSTVNEGFITTLKTTISAGATSMILNGVSGLVDGSIFVGIIEPGAVNQQTFTGTINLGTNSVVNVVWTRGTNVNHAGGVTIVDYVTGTDFNMLSTGVQKSLKQDGSLGPNALKQVYPIGCIYIETTGANPNISFGFGAWVAFGAGQVLIGNGTSDQAFVAGTTGGESTHVLTTSEMPSHSHDAIGNSAGSPSGNSLQDKVNGNNTGNHYPTSSTGGGLAHNNLQPYIVVYFWKRIA